MREITTTFAARSDDEQIGTVEVLLDGDGVPPLALRDQHGSTYVLVYSAGGKVSFAEYQRVRCAEATLRVKP